MGRMKKKQLALKMVDRKKDGVVKLMEGKPHVPKMTAAESKKKYRNMAKKFHNDDVSNFMKSRGLGLTDKPLKK